MKFTTKKLLLALIIFAAHGTTLLNAAERYGYRDRREYPDNSSAPGSDTTTDRTRAYARMVGRGGEWRDRDSDNSLQALINDLHDKMISSLRVASADDYNTDVLRSIEEAIQQISTAATTGQAGRDIANLLREKNGYTVGLVESKARDLRAERETLLEMPPTRTAAESDEYLRSFLTIDWMKLDNNDTARTLNEFLVYAEGSRSASYVTATAEILQQALARYTEINWVNQIGQEEYITAFIRFIAYAAQHPENKRRLLELDNGTSHSLSKYLVADAREKYDVTKRQVYAYALLNAGYDTPEFLHAVALLLAEEESIMGVTPKFTHQLMGLLIEKLLDPARSYNAALNKAITVLLITTTQESYALGRGHIYAINMLGYNNYIQASKQIIATIEGTTDKYEAEQRSLQKVEDFRLIEWGVEETPSRAEEQERAALTQKAKSLQARIQAFIRSTEHANPAFAQKSRALYDALWSVYDAPADASLEEINTNFLAINRNFTLLEKSAIAQARWKKAINHATSTHKAEKAKEVRRGTLLRQGAAKIADRTAAIKRKFAQSAQTRAQSNIAMRKAEEAARAEIARKSTVRDKWQSAVKKTVTTQRVANVKAAGYAYKQEEDRKKTLAAEELRKQTAAKKIQAVVRGHAGRTTASTLRTKQAEAAQKDEMARLELRERERIESARIADMRAAEEARLVKQRLAAEEERHRVEAASGLKAAFSHDRSSAATDADRMRAEKIAAQQRAEETVARLATTRSMDAAGKRLLDVNLVYLALDKIAQVKPGLQKFTAMNAIGDGSIKIGPGSWLLKTVVNGLDDKGWEMLRAMVRDNGLSFPVFDEIMGSARAFTEGTLHTIYTKLRS